MRARGIGEPVRLALQRVREEFSSHETLTFFVRPTAARPGRPRPPDGASLRTLAPQDARAYARTIGTDSAASFRARLGSESRCYAVEDAGRLVHASWVTTACAWTREIRAFVCVGAGAAYVYESFTDAATRGRGFYPFALDEIAADLSARNVSVLWVAVEATNAPSLKAVAKAGFEAGFSIDYGRSLGRLRLSLPDRVKSDTTGAGVVKKRRIWLPGDGAIQQGKP